VSASFVLAVSVKVTCARGVADRRAISRGLFKVAISCLQGAGLVEYSGVDPRILENITPLLNSAPLGKQSQLARKEKDVWDLQTVWRQWHSRLE
jgi:Nup85 Nucleoporin